ncbi:MAG: hypothetical protein H6701_13010, partial [Myxococcales bacterium]|nr:hypothetical protein [Myxococcales bacterium]
MTPRRGALLSCMMTLALAGCSVCDSNSDCNRGERCTELTSPLVTVCVNDAPGPDTGPPSCDGFDGGRPTEACNGLDDDCDGAVDEPPEGGFPCYPYGQGLDDPTAGRGACRVGTMACHDGTLGACEGAVTPGAELCNGIDDDCSGAADPANPDDGLMQSCARGCPDEVVAGQ